MNIIRINTDGSSLGNPGPGGMGIVIDIPNENRITIGLYGGDPVTNNQMEMDAVIKALSYIEELNLGNHPIEVVTDSQYVIKGITEWIHGWKRKAFKGVKNAERWEELDAINSELSVTYSWIKGHQGDMNNELADRLAQTAARSKENYINFEENDTHV